MRPLDPQIGEVLGSYRLMALLGRGGMASVFLAEHTRLTKKAAVKVLEAQTAADPISVSRFLAGQNIDTPDAIQLNLTLPIAFGEVKDPAEWGNDDEGGGPPWP
ncbi:MAG: hypothetical protein KC933_17235 [Myxococcales bacterium]|nr:hypothetical protein [Myxococcales bacterium]